MRLGMASAATWERAAVMEVKLGLTLTAMMTYLDWKAAAG
jgi:hypothetical protein